MSAAQQNRCRLDMQPPGLNIYASQSRTESALTCRVSRACSSRIGPCILVMLPQLDQDLEQRAVSLQPADDGLRVGPAVMPVSSVTLSDGHGGENGAGPFWDGSGRSALARQGTQIALIRVACTGPRAG